MSDLQVSLPRFRNGSFIDGALNRLRKIKCDEAWPICHRCHSTNRVCGGYGVWGGGGGGGGYDSGKEHSRPGGRSNDSGKLLCHSSNPAGLVSSHITRQLKNGILSLDEQHCLGWFIHRTATKLPGAFISNFWTTLLVQACSTEPAVLHAVLALSSAHRQEVLDASGRGLREILHQQRMTTQQHTRAVMCLQPYFSNTTIASIRVALISCAMFIYLEFLRGHYATGIIHLQHGLNLQGELQRAINAGCGALKQPISFDDGWIITIFTRLLVQIKLLGQHVQLQNLPFGLSESEARTNTFHSIHHARRVLEHLLLRIFYLEDQCCSRDSLLGPDFYSTWQSRQRRIQDELRSWINAYEATMEDRPYTFNGLGVFAYSLLHLYHAMATIMADTCVGSPNESRFDRHLSSFNTVISRCIKCHKIVFQSYRRSPTYDDDARTTSISDMGWIPPLYYTVIKCRNRRLRLQALKLLELTPHKEGLWDARLAAAVARKVMDIEEREFYRDADASQDFDLFSTATDQELAIPILPEEYRINKVNVALPDSPTGRLRLTCSQRGEPGPSRIIVREYDLPSQRWLENCRQGKQNG